MRTCRLAEPVASACPHGRVNAAAGRMQSASRSILKVSILMSESGGHRREPCPLPNGCSGQPSKKKQKKHQVPRVELIQKVSTKALSLSCLLCFSSWCLVYTVSSPPFSAARSPNKAHQQSRLCRRLSLLAQSSKRTRRQTPMRVTDFNRRSTGKSKSVRTQLEARAGGDPERVDSADQDGAGADSGARGGRRRRTCVDAGKRMCLMRIQRCLWGRARARRARPSPLYSQFELCGHRPVGIAI